MASWELQAPVRHDTDSLYLVKGECCLSISKIIVNLISKYPILSNFCWVNLSIKSSQHACFLLDDNLYLLYDSSDNTEKQSKKTMLYPP